MSCSLTQVHKFFCRVADADGKIWVVFWFEQSSGASLSSAKVWRLLIITQLHALHTKNSPFAGMLMFTEAEVIKLKTSVNVSWPSQCGLDDFHPFCRVAWRSQTLELIITPTLLPATSVCTIPYRSCLHLRHPKSRIFGSQQVCQPRMFF